ncbi:MAG: hypothetical protein AAB797_00760 [Patescibacteria group bacterium]
MPLVILTEPINGVGFFSPRRFLEITKKYIRNFLGRSRGPQAVTNSLLAGLKEMEINYVLNPESKNIKDGAVVYVNESAEALRDAIDIKKKGRISKIIAGPIIAVLPNEKNGIMLDVNIDLLPFPSAWTKDFWVAQAPQLAAKIKIWPAGVGSDCDLSQTRDLVLVYYKSGPKKQLNYIINFLKSKNIPYEAVRYGHYRKEDYFGLLARAKSLIYLSESESQGLALGEAWMHNVPTLVWNRGYWEYCGYKWFDGKISAPYLTAECGLFFAGEEDFSAKWRDFTGNLSLYKPRDYALTNFTNTLAAKRFIDLIKVCCPDFSFI